MALIWITGARGFLGRYVARRFADAGWSVAGLGLSGPADAALDALPLARIGDRPAWLEGIIDGPMLEKLLDLTGPPDAVFHAAGSGAVGPSFADPLRDFRMAVESTALVLDLLRRCAPTARFVLPSSAAVYGCQPSGPIAEDTPPDPVSPYGTHKLAAEWLCRSAARNFGQPCAVIRYFSLYGPELRKQLLWDIATRLASDPEEIVLAGTGEETRDMLFAADAAELAFKVMTRADDAFCTVNGGTGAASTVREVAESLIAALGTRTKVRFNGNVRSGDPVHLQADIALAAGLGFKPRCSLAEGVRAYAAWWRDAHAA